MFLKQEQRVEKLVLVLLSFTLMTITREEGVENIKTTGLLGLVNIISIQE